jgi:hypothetical protein
MQVANKEGVDDLLAAQYHALRLAESLLKKQPPERGCLGEDVSERGCLGEDVSERGCLGEDGSERGCL